MIYSIEIGLPLVSNETETTSREKTYSNVLIKFVPKDVCVVGRGSNPSGAALGREKLFA